jgi:hypothetical protein
MKSNTLQLALIRAETLPEAAQEELGRDVLLRINLLEELRAEIQIGVDQFDAGQGGPIDLDKLKAEARQLYGDRV